ncbi:cupin domain-containing protein [Aquabacterium sp. G14]|uniref:cupin domain-containing protein n=1 Tax=Aquabacterium sp. G14 TaxID=3130164 RepID=UPI0030AC6599
MSIVLVSVENEGSFGNATPVGAPTSAEVALTRIASSATTPSGSVGVWECSPGKFLRQVIPAEYSYIIEGEGSFTAEDGQKISFKAGDSIYFPSNSKGEWEISKKVRKSYIILG